MGMEDMDFETRVLGGTEVIMGSELIGHIVRKLNHSFPEGAVCLLYDRNVSGLADAITSDLKRAGYRIFLKGVSSKRRKGDESEPIIPEYVRHVIAVGAGTASEEAKRLAGTLKTDWSLYLTAPSTDTIMSGFSPKAVFIDKNVLLNCPNECKAAGYGILFSQPLCAFERFFKRKVLASENCEYAAFSKSVADVSELAFELLKISAAKTDDSSEIMAEILYARAVKQGKVPRLLGEYRFLASTVISAFYSQYLGALAIDAMPPAARCVAADSLLKTDYRNRAKSVDFFDVNGYFRISYILGEYRTDLLEKLSNAEFHTSQRFWRRLYSDAGFWLKSELDCRELLSCLALAGHESDNLLGYAYASGALQGFEKLDTKETE